MAAFTTPSSASTYIINTLILIAVIAIAGVVGSYVMLNHTPAGRPVAAMAAPPADTDATAAPQAPSAGPQHAN